MAGIDKALVLLPPRPGSSLHPEQISPLVRVGGITLLQRTLYNLQWAGIREGVLLSYGRWPEAEQAVRLDEKNQVFTWITLSDMEPGSEEEARLKRLLSGPVLVQFPGWIVARNLIQDLLRDTKPGSPFPENGTVLEAADRYQPGPESFPALAVVPAHRVPGLTRSLLRKTPLEEVKNLLNEAPQPQIRTIDEPELIRVQEPEDRGPAEELLLQGLIKPTESWLSRNFERKVSLSISRRLLHTEITPNQVSIFSLLMGLASALLFLPDNKGLHVSGGLLLLFSSIVDGCDGELARLRYQESRVGSWLDFLGDNLVHMAVFLCIGFGLYQRGEGTVYLLLGIAAAVSTCLAASSVFLRVVLKSKSSVITFATPVRVEEMEQATGRLRKQIDFTDKISNRDFIYAILILAVAGQMWLFAWLSGLGSMFYLGSLTYLYWRMGIIGGGSRRATS